MKQNIYSIMAIVASVFGLMELHPRTLPRDLDTLLAVTGIFLVVKAILRKEEKLLVIMGAVLCTILLVIIRLPKGGGWH